MIDVLFDKIDVLLQKYQIKLTGKSNEDQNYNTKNPYRTLCYLTQLLHPFNRQT